MEEQITSHSASATEGALIVLCVTFAKPFTKPQLWNIHTLTQTHNPKGNLHRNEVLCSTMHLLLAPSFMLSIFGKKKERERIFHKHIHLCKKNIQDPFHEFFAYFSFQYQIPELVKRPIPRFWCSCQILFLALFQISMQDFSVWWVFLNGMRVLSYCLSITVTGIRYKQLNSWTLV